MSRRVVNPIIRIYTHVGTTNTIHPIRIQLRKDILPNTVNRILSYINDGIYNNKSTSFHRTEFRNATLIGGLLKNNPAVASSMFPDENFDLSHNHAPYVVSLLNCGPNTNNTQFMITTPKMSPEVRMRELDNTFVCIGRVLGDPQECSVVDSILEYLAATTPNTIGKRGGGGGGGGVVIESIVLETMQDRRQRDSS
eukprot:PhF_6_TR7064/c0_g1_i1/m.10674